LVIPTPEYFVFAAVNLFH